MIHSGRHRYKTHAGIPHGSTNNLGSDLAFYLQWKEGCTAAQWDDQSSNNNHAAQSTAGDQAAIAADGSLDFVLSEADHYDFGTDAAIANEEGFVVWVVVNLDDSTVNTCVFGMGTAAHFLEFRAGGDDMGVKLGGTNTTVSPGDGTNNDFASGSKMVVAMQKEAGGTGNINLYKNGVLLAQDSQASNHKDAEFNTLGMRSGDRYLDGKIYDVIFIQEGAASLAHIKRISTYLCAKHGISETL